MNWKKNIRNIPKKISGKLTSIKEPNLVAGCLKTFSGADIQQGILAHLEIGLDNAGLKFPESIIPSAHIGKYSSWNIYGCEVIRNDLPKETHYNYVETPNWGDSYNGTHTVALPYKKFPRDFIAPRYSAIEIECANAAPGQSLYIIKFNVSEILNKKDKDFNERLLTCLNLLQENIGDCGVEQANSTLADYARTLQVQWDILPPGTIEEAIARLFTHRKPTPKEIIYIEERFNFFKSLKPKKEVYGTSGLQRYFGALINDDLIIFENVKYGNAIYIMFEDWKELSQKSRIDLLSGKLGHNFERIVHTGNWKSNVKKIIKEKLKRK
jgi:hypothetical protein